MSQDYDRLQLLKIRNAIADKEWCIACANKETAGGGWTCDWQAEYRRADEAIQELLAVESASCGRDGGGR